jgi:hypothetical protein
VNDLFHFKVTLSVTLKVFCLQLRSQSNQFLLELTINGKIPVGAFRDEKVTKLGLSSRSYKAADGIIIASLLKVFTCSMS